MPPQRRREPERHYRITYRFDGRYATARLSIPGRTHHLETSLRQAVSKHETHVAARFHEVELVDFEEMHFPHAA